jgi:colanic acid/amylovoran biosynthesis protein
MSNKKKLTIGLLWHSISSDNLGVGALTESQIAIIRGVATRLQIPVRFIVFGTLGGKSYPPANADVRVGSRISIKQILQGKSPFVREVSECDVVFDIGEGDSFADIYGIKRYLFQIVSKVAVVAKKRPLILSPQTIGPFDRWYTRLVAAMVMKKAHKVFARDHLSANYLKDMGVEGYGEVVDLAFKLPYSKPDAASGATNVAINVSGLLYSGGYSGGNQFGLSVDYRAHVEYLIEYFLGQEGVDVWLVPHVIPDDIPNDDDRVAIGALQLKYPKVKISPEFGSPSSAKSFIAGMSFLTGARMHACIAAFSSGVPVVPLAYSRKFNGLFSSLNYRHVADGKKMSTEECNSAVVSGYLNRASLAADVAEGNIIAHNKLLVYENYIEGLLKHVSSLDKK